MRKFNKKPFAIIGAVILGLSIIALPALGDTTPGKGSWFKQMNDLMNRITPEQHNALMKSDAMQEFHDSEQIQNTVKEGDFEEVKTLINSDDELKEQIGEDNLEALEEFMDSEEFCDMHQDLESMNEMHEYMHGSPQYSGNDNNMMR